jgi:NlpC/P60 family putative phage cell wall peptidase
MSSNAGITAIARSWIGTPFHHQACVKGIGCDCLGLVRGVWRELYQTESALPPAYAFDWARDPSRELLMDAFNEYFLPAAGPCRADQLILFRWHIRWTASHVAIASSSSTLIHAQDGAGVCEVPMPIAWRKRIAACFEFPPI